MNIKSKVFPEKDRYKQVGKSVFDFDWIDELPQLPTFLLAEGVFMFCTENDVKSLFQQIHNRIPGTDMVFEAFSSKWLSGWRKKLVDFKLRRQLKFGEDASFRFGIADSDEIETWSQHFKLIEDWCYVDEIKPNAKEWMRKFQWTVHYRIL
jgi:O-methyltransferase involved in polyketide biosynthesis